MRYLGQNPDNSEIHDILNEFDPNSTSLIEYPDFLQVSGCGGVWVVCGVCVFVLCWCGDVVWGEWWWWMWVLSEAPYRVP
jgi:hypothetical protein